MMGQPAVPPAPAVPAAPAVPPAPLIWASSWMGSSYLGVGVADVDGDRAKALNLKEVRGVELTKVEDDSPASKAGLKTGDVVLEYNGQRIEGTEQLLRMVRETPANREIKMTVSRSGQIQTVALTTGKRKSAAYLTREGQPMRIEVPMPRVEVNIPDIPRATMSWRSGMLGIEAESIEGGLAEYFGVKEGALVRNVGKGTAAEKAGVKAGDVIVKIDDKAVDGPRQITIAIRGLREKDKKTFPVTLMREKRETTVTVTLDDPEPAPARAPRARSVNND